MKESEKIKEEGLEMPKVNPEVNIYEPKNKEILYYDDGIQVKGQKESRRKNGDKSSINDIETSKVQNRLSVHTNVIMLEKKGGDYKYIASGIDNVGNEVIPIEAVAKSEIINEYGCKNKELNIVCITDGASNIRHRIEITFGMVITIILDWYHLCEKIRKHMSMIAINKEEKRIHLRYLFYNLWRGMVNEALIYLKNDVKSKNKEKLLDLISYIEKHKNEIINYKKRKESGKVIGSGRIEKGVDQVVGIRQKKKGMSWTKAGSKGLAILKVAERNGSWKELWFPKAA